MSMLQRLSDRGPVKPPRWPPGTVVSGAIMRSGAHGSSADASDMDVSGRAFPEEHLGPRLRGEVPGFGRPVERFGVDQQHHVADRDALAGRGRADDPTIFGVVRLFAPAPEDDPNVIASPSTPATCVLHRTKGGNLAREHRELSLHKGTWPKSKVAPDRERDLP